MSAIEIFPYFCDRLRRLEISRRCSSRWRLPNWAAIDFSPRRTSERDNGRIGDYQSSERSLMEKMKKMNSLTSCDQAMLSARTPPVPSDPISPRSCRSSSRWKRTPCAAWSSSPGSAWKSLYVDGPESVMIVEINWKLTRSP